MITIHRGFLALLFFLFVSVFSTIVNAALVERLGGLAYYDDQADITWLADANYAYTSGLDNDGRFTQDQGIAFADSVTIAGVSGWRLPVSDGCTNFNCTGSEMGNLFYNVLGGEAGSSIHDVHNSNYSLFSNIVNPNYWSGSEQPGSPARGMVFTMSSGYQNDSNQYNASYLWLVHSGDVTVVPLPAAVWLFASGLVCLIGVRPRNRYTPPYL